MSQLIQAKLTGAIHPQVVTAPKKTTRTCLWCDRKFESVGPGNRRCKKCTSYTPKERAGGVDKTEY
jgi:tRNA(Ile2) C34 agmatinyltransferase TiaS